MVQEGICIVYIKKEKKLSKQGKLSNKMGQDLKKFFEKCNFYCAWESYAKSIFYTFKIAFFQARQTK